MAALSCAIGTHIAHEEQVMLDAILVAGAIGFFILSIAYAFGCDRL